MPAAAPTPQPAADGAPTPAGRRGRLRFMLRALSHRNYRLFFGGQIVSLVGTWLSMVATSWLVYRLASEQSPGEAALWLGVVGFSGQIPVFLFAPFAGVWVDRWPRRAILIGTQAVSMAQSFALAWLVFGGHATIGQVIALSIVQGVINAFDLPARQSFLVDLVGGPDLANAIALNSSMVHSARLVGPAVAGVLIYYFGEATCFLIDGFSFLGVLLALAAIRVERRALSAAYPRAWQALQEGLRYAFGFPPIRTLLLLVALTSLTSMSQSVLMPMFADRILGGGERTLGLLLGANGAGALTGSLYLASRRSILGLGRVAAIACLALGVGLICFSLSRSLWLSMGLLYCAGMAMVVQMASCNTLLQTIVDEDKRGRTMSLFTMAFMGMSPFGSLAAGALASALSAPTTMAIAGAICLAGGIAFSLLLPALRRMVRPIYERKGILPQVARGIQSTAQLATLSSD